MLKRWAGFTSFLDDGRICPTNNAAERALRGFALGRKSWLFAGSDSGAERAAFMATLIMSAKLNDIDPQAWLADVLANIADMPISRLEQLLPCWCGRLPMASQCARMSSLKAQSRETVRGTDYQNWHRYVKERFPIAWRERIEQPVVRKKFSRREMVKFFEKAAPTTIAFEACRGSHHWARLLGSLGHEVKLIAPQLAKPYVKRGKNDAADAEALC